MNTDKFKSSTAFGTADILLPDPDKTDMGKWAVVACDQFTSQPEYWEDAYLTAGDSPSALRLILPEAYLEGSDADERISDIRNAMEEYISKGIFREYKNSMIYVERTDSMGNLRCGIVGAIDLEQYDYRKGSVSPVRATEATVAERIPPRLRVRRDAPLELPHIMILIDDPQSTVIEPAGKCRDSLEKLYDFTLMKNGGSIRGYLMKGDIVSRTDKALAVLGDKESFAGRYGSDVPVILFAMGDGNHSLATAKEYYEELKRSNPGKDLSNHPARYALAEIVNLHSDALKFEAIHRIIKGADTSDLLSQMNAALGLTENISRDMQSFEWVCGGKSVKFGIERPTSNLTVGSVQNFLDEYIEKNGGKIDYIHGADIVRRFSEKEGYAGILLPDMSKNELFPTIIKDGALPRKTFSMGHAEDKRYYVEARRIREY